MNRQWPKLVLAGAMITGLALPGWPVERVGPATNPPAKEMRPLKKARPKGSDSIRKVQAALKAKGHNPGRIDGLMGRRTRAAIRAFQEQNSLSPSGILDDQTADLLGVERPKRRAKKAAKQKQTKS